MVIEFLDRFLKILSENEDFRMGYVLGFLTPAAFAGIWYVCFVIYSVWLRIRKFFEPTKKPGDMPTKPGPSPAGMLMGCLGNVILLVSIFGGIGLIIWFTNNSLDLDALFRP